MYVYKIVNSVNNKVYVGCTSRSVDLRWKEHCRLDGSTALDNAIRKYGVSAFFYEVLEVCNTEQDMFLREQYWIQKLDSISEGYNIHIGGAKPPSPLGIPKSPEHRSKIGASNKGKTRTAEHLNKMNSARTKTGVFGATHSLETKLKMSLAAKARWANAKIQGTA